MEAANLHKNQPKVGSGELVLQNGRQAGTRRPLGIPTTFIGRNPGCDVRLNVEGVDPLHCLLVFGPDGLVMRDLNSVHGSFVNGERSEHLTLKHGDFLKIGPFQFRVELTAVPIATQPDIIADELRDALRVQAAAVAAQQAALEEEEARLCQRKGDLQQQEEQLAAHLAEKQRQVQLWSEYTKAEREALRKEKLDNEKRLARLEEELIQGKEELARDHQKLTAERQHINKVYQRLRQRWQRQWGAQKEKYRKLGEELAAEKAHLEQMEAALTGRETVLGQDVLRFETERELGLRRLQEERETLTKDQEGWRKRRSFELTALNARRRELEETELRVAQVRQLLVKEKDAWDRQQLVLQKELHGLNNRIVHQRARIQEQSEELARLEKQRRKQQPVQRDKPADDADVHEALECAVEVVDEAATTTTSQAEDWQQRCDDLERLAGELADQRSLLVEQYARLVEIQESWQQERGHAAAELEALGQRMAVEEQALTLRQQQTIAGESQLHERRQEIDAVRQEIMVWRTQLKGREQTFAEEYQKELEALRSKETLLDEQLAGLTQLRQRWNRRRQQEVEQALADRAVVERERKETHGQRVELFEKTQRLAEEKRVLAEKSLALEQYRQEVFVRANDPAAQRRIERLRRRWLTLNAAMIANAKNEREITKKDLARLDAARTELLEQLNAITQNDAALSEKRSLLDEREANLKARHLQLEQELNKLESQRREAEAAYVRMKGEGKKVYQEDAAPSIDKAA
jgi:chromosome segregation ATPase